MLHLEPLGLLQQVLTLSLHLLGIKPNVGPRLERGERLDGLVDPAWRRRSLGRVTLGSVLAATFLERRTSGTRSEERRVGKECRL